MFVVVLPSYAWDFVSHTVVPHACKHRIHMCKHSIGYSGVFVNANLWLILLVIGVNCLCIAHQTSTFHILIAIVLTH